MSDNKSEIWSSASGPAILLGCISIVYVLLTYLAGRFIHAAVLNGLIECLLWLGKLVFSLGLLKYLLIKYSALHPDADNSEVFRYGMVLAALSALVYSAFYLFYVSYLVPDQISQAFDMIMSQYSSKLDAESISSLENMQGSMGGIYFFTNLIYCFLFGTIASRIYSRDIPSRNPFINNGQQ